MMRAATALLLAIAVTTALAFSSPAPASAATPGGVLCTFTGLVSGVMGKVCNLAIHAGRVVGAGRKLFGGHLGGAVGELTGGAAAPAATTAVGLAAIAASVVGGARYLLGKTADVIGATTSPDLTSTWFSAAYWRMAAIAALLTLPFLFAAAVQAMIRSDLGLLVRAAFGYLPLALLAVGVAAPLTMLLLSASDEMSALIASASGHSGAAFLARAAGAGGLVSLLGQNLFVSFFVALLTAAATLALWVELVIRDAAVYVIVLMLPLFFAAMVWPARRVWAARTVELLVALILSKFVIVAVLTLGGAALGHTIFPGLAATLTGTTLVMLAAFSPWALMRLLPLQELAGAAAGGLRGGGLRTLPSVAGAADVATDGTAAPPELDAEMRLSPGVDPEDGPRMIDLAPTPEARSAESGAAAAPTEAGADATAAQSTADAPPRQSTADAPPTESAAAMTEGEAPAAEPGSLGIDSSGPTDRKPPMRPPLRAAGSWHPPNIHTGPGDLGDPEHPLLDPADDPEGPADDPEGPADDPEGPAGDGAEPRDSAPTADHAAQPPDLTPTADHAAQPPDPAPAPDAPPTPAPDPDQ